MAARSPEAAKEYLHFDGGVLDKRDPEAAKEYLHFDGGVLDKREE